MACILDNLLRLGQPPALDLQLDPAQDGLRRELRTRLDPSPSCVGRLDPPTCLLTGAQQVEGLIPVRFSSQQRAQLARGGAVQSVVHLLLDFGQDSAMAPDPRPPPAAPEHSPGEDDEQEPGPPSPHSMAHHDFPCPPGRRGRDQRSRSPSMSLPCRARQPKPRAGCLDTAAVPGHDAITSPWNAPDEGSTSIMSRTAVCEEA